MRTSSLSFDHLSAYIRELPLIDCHEHMSSRERIGDVLQFFCSGYYAHDLTSAAGEVATGRILDASLPLDDRCDEFLHAWRATRFTGYGIAVRYAMQRLFGIEEPTRANLKDAQERLPDYAEPDAFDRILEEAGIVVRISDCWPPPAGLIDGSWEPLPRQRLALSLPFLHAIRTRGDLAPLETACRATVTCLDEWLDLCRRYIEAGRDRGAVCLKDQSAYDRSITYRMPTRADAEAVFNRILADPRYHAEYDPDANALSDFLMHALMRIAREADLPVQLHTGHMAGIRNDVAKANAAGLRSLIEVHRDVRFDLFHANWPYSSDALFLAKNYPNVTLDFCWTHIVDPVYARSMLVQAVSAVPHTKIHGFGSDVGGGLPHIAWAHAALAREVIACALSDLVEMGHVTLSEAKEIARAWCFDNPNAFFGLGLTGSGE